MENRGQKRMEDVDELPADKRACNSQDSRTSTSDSSAHSQSQEAANGASSGHENTTDADMDTSSSESPSTHSDAEQDREEEEEEEDDYGSCDSDDDDGGEDPRHRVLKDCQWGRSSEDQQKLTSLVSRLSEEVDPSLQLTGLTELCEVLSFCTEDSLSTVMADSLSRVLVNLANHESNADIMLLAIRAITYLSDVYPRSVAFLVKHETLPALCQRLQAIEYLDVAEQCLQALEKISKDDPVACLNAGAIKAVLSYIDFFSTSLQRVAVSTVMNISRKLSSESPSPVMDAVPILCNLLQYEDRQLVESVAICLTTIVDQVSQLPEMVAQLCSHQLIHQSIHLLNLNGRTTLSQPVYNGLIGLLRKLSSGSALAFGTLYELNIGYRLKEIISTYDISNSVSSTHPINASCSNQVHEVLKLVIELLPSSPAEDNQLALEKESFLVNHPDLLQQFGADMLPVMIQVLNSGANVYVSYGCLSAIHKLTCLSNSADFIELLKNANILSVLAGILSRKDHHVVVVALQIAEVLLEKYRDAFLNSFIKEGVFFAIEGILNSDRGQQNPASGLIQGSVDVSQKHVPKEIVKCLCQSFERSISSSSQTCKIEKDSVYIFATRIKESFFGPEVFDSQKGVTDVLQSLKHLSAALNDLMTVPIDAHSLHGEKFFSIWNQIMERLNGKESVSTFEFTKSGVVKALANYLSNGLHQRIFSKGDPECDSLPFVGNRFEVFTRLLWSDGEATSSVLVKKLQNSLSSSENYPIVLSQFLKQRNSFATVPNGRSTTYPILRVRFVKAEGETCLRDYSQDLVTVDPLCYLDAVDQYMWPKVHLKPLDSVEAKDQAMECQSSQLQSTSISCQGESSSHMEIDSPNASQGSEEEDQEQLTDSGEDNTSSSEEKDASPRLLFRLEGVELDRSLTVYQAILLHKLKSASETTNDSKLSGTHTITYERAPQLADSHENLIPLGSIMNNDEYHPFLSYLFAHRLGLRHKKTNPPAYDILFLLKSLEGINRFLFHLICHERINAFGEGRLDNLDDLRVEVRPVPYAEFVSSKLTEKLEQQMRDSFALSTCGLPPWFNDLMGSCPFLFSFEVKSKYFRLAAFGSQKVHHHPQHLSSSNSHGEGRPVTGSLPRKKFLACRENILEAASKMMELHGNQKVVIEVEYSEEVGTGLGPTLEFYTLVSRAFQDPDLGMWRNDRSSFAGKPKEDSGFLVTPSGLFPRPWSDTSAAFPDVLQKFVLLGTVVAKALHDGRVLDIPFSKAFYKLILGQELSSFDIHFVDPELCKTLVELQALARRKKLFSESQGKCDLSFRGTNIEDLCLEFTLPGYSDYVLTPHSSNDMVNLDNLEEYIKAIVNATVCNGIQKQVEAFRSGFNKVFPIEHLEIFNEEELETLLCGERDLFNMNEVLDHIKFDHGYTSSSPPVENLLEILHEFDKEQQRAFLQFVTGCPRLPPGGLASLNPKLTIVRKHGSDSSETDLPSVMTCANYLKLPPYSSKVISLFIFCYPLSFSYP